MKHLLITLLFLTGILTTACPAPCDLNDDEIKAVRADLAPIVQAIENFNKEQKRYPGKLDELVPKYLDKIPPTAGGRKYEYVGTSPDQRYNIRINSKNGGSYSGSCSYSEIDD